MRMAVLVSMIVTFGALAPQTQATKRRAPERQPAVSAERVNAAELKGGAPSGPALLKLQILLDRAHFSPGEIDGKMGENTKKAIAAYRAKTGARAGDWSQLGSDTGEVLVPYRIQAADTRGPFIDRVPDDFEDKAALDKLAFTSVVEGLAEKFHVSEDLLRLLNPSAEFDVPGTEIIVPEVERRRLPKIARLEVDGAKQELRAFDEADEQVAFYPATVGSTSRPSPEGDFKVQTVAKNPVYHYDPANRIEGVAVDRPLDIKPGPNNPVGLVWIGLSAESYGIHGTPEPGKISKSASHGCVRLTNWDALYLAERVSKGTPVSIRMSSTTGARASGGRTRSRSASR